MINAGLESMLPPAHRMAITITEARVGFAAAEVPVDGNTNHIGTMYAGTLFAVAEILGGAISLATFDAGQFYPTVKDVQIRFRLAGAIRGAGGDRVGRGVHRPHPG